MVKTVYYLPGWSGQLQTGLGKALLDRGFDVTGRETRGEFKDLSFSEQVQTIRHDLLKGFWNEESLVVGNSFGGYLFLHAQSELPPFPGKVLLLSPIVGGFADEITGRFFSPPKEHLLLERAKNHSFPIPIDCQVHTGSEDWQSSPDAVRGFFKHIGIEPVIATGKGHMLGESYVGPVLDRFLCTS